MASREERLKVREDRKDTFVAIDVGDQIVGKLLDVREIWSDQRNGFYPMLVIDVDNSTTGNRGPTNWHAFGHAASAEVLRLQPMPGERLRITYRGEHTKAKPGQNPAKLFTVEVAGRSVEQAAKNAYARMGQQPRPQRAPDEFAEPVSAPQSELPIGSDDFSGGGARAADDDIPF